MQRAATPANIADSGQDKRIVHEQDKRTFEIEKDVYGEREGKFNDTPGLHPDIPMAHPPHQQSHLPMMSSLTFQEFPNFLNSPGEYCYDPSITVGGGGNSTQPQAWATESYIPVKHSYNGSPYPGMTQMEENNLWMFILDQSLPPPGPETLMYRPGKTIAFADVKHALQYFDYQSFDAPILPARTKAEAMQFLTKRLRSQFQSLVFYQHLDHLASCGGRCCEKGSKYRREIVALRGWNRYNCPGHENVTYFSHPCDCKSHGLAC